MAWWFWLLVVGGYLLVGLIVATADSLFDFSGTGFAVDTGDAFQVLAFMALWPVVVGWWFVRALSLLAGVINRKR